MRGPNPQQKFRNLNLGVVTTPFGGQTEQENFHPGVDIANSSGTPIHAPVNAIVTKVENGHAQFDNSFGNTLEFRDSEGKTHQFHHLQDILAKPGQQIQEGQPVATMGKTGAVYSPTNRDPSNLDYRIVTRYGKYLNPLSYLNKL
jgi:murein DD-endopeptidase MepM/ murein hydrolase activator NlpD